MSYKFLFLISLSLTAIVAKSQYADSPINDTTVIAFSSDTQAPMWVETLWLKKTNNKLATHNLFTDIANRRPGSLFILGDVVNLGSSNKQWRPMDKYLKTLRNEGVNVYAALGNHEVMGNAAKGERKFQQRFPQHCPTGYVEIKDSIAVVLLNSNFNKLSAVQNEVQEEWYENTLDRLDADPSIQFIITGCHHSPFTNSKIVKPSTEVQERFVPAFLKSSKSRLFVSGHCHGFEHFKVEGKDFLVIGGGGGLHQPLKTGEGITPDLAADYKPLFHYLTVKRNGGQLELTSYKINNDYNSFAQGLAFEVEKTDSRTVKSTTKAAD